jgi:hypothetical protein
MVPATFHAACAMSIVCVAVCAAEARERELTEQFLAKCRSQDERERALQAARDQVRSFDCAHTHTHTYTHAHL